MFIAHKWWFEPLWFWCPTKEKENKMRSLSSILSTGGVGVGGSNDVKAYLNNYWPTKATFKRKCIPTFVKARFRNWANGIFIRNSEVIKSAVDRKWVEIKIWKFGHKNYSQGNFYNWVSPKYFYGLPPRKFVILESMLRSLDWDYNII